MFFVNILFRRKTSKYPVYRYRQTFSHLITSGANELQGLTERPPPIALGLTSGDLTATELLLVVAQSSYRREDSLPLYGYTIPHRAYKVNDYFQNS